MNRPHTRRTPVRLSLHLSLHLAPLLALLGLALAVAVPAQAAPEDPPRWQADALFDQFRPVIVPRELTSAEREDVRALARKHRAAAAPWQAADRAKEGRPVGEVRQQATLLRLFELGESGDKEAMLAARGAIAADTICGGWGEDAPFVLLMDDYHKCHYAQAVARALTGYWTALIWQRHGPERSAEAYFGLKSCFMLYQATAHGNRVFTGRNPFVNCGFSMQVSDAALKSRDMKKRGSIYLELALEHYWKNGGKPPLEVVAFYPTVGDAEFDRKRFQGLLASYKPFEGPDSLGLESKWTDTDRAWVAYYAAANKREVDVKAMLDRAARALADERWYAAHREKMLNQMTCDKDFATLTNTHLQVTDSAVRSLEGYCAAAGDEYLERFAHRFTVMNPANIDRLCKAGSSACTRQQAAQNQRSAEEAEWEKAKRDAVNNAFTGKLPPASVNVRKYDQNGNYIGTETMTRGEAELRGAK